MSHRPADALVEELRKKGLRITAPRKAVVEVLATAHEDHLTAEDLHRRAELAAGRNIDPSTIYRIIEVLEEAGSIHHVHLGHGPGVIHMSDRSAHHHLVCEVCGRTVDLPLREIDDLVGRIESQYGFRADSVHFALVGRCVEHDR